MESGEKKSSQSTPVSSQRPHRGEMQTSCEGGRGNEKHLSNRNLITVNFHHKQIRSRPHLSVLPGLQLSLIRKYPNYFYSQEIVYCQAQGILYCQTIFFFM